MLDIQMGMRIESVHHISHSAFPQSAITYMPVDDTLLAVPECLDLICSRDRACDSKIRVRVDEGELTCPTRAPTILRISAEIWCRLRICRPPPPPTTRD